MPIFSFPSAAISTSSAAGRSVLDAADVAAILAILGVTPGGEGGATWYHGSGVPSSGLGVNGDFYLNDDSSDYYAKAAGAWTLAGNLKGSTGATGAAGAQGSQGATGNTGPQGDPGADGEGVPVGGTAGQVLTKVDGVDYNTAWTAPSAVTVNSTDIVDSTAAGRTLLTDANAAAQRTSLGLGSAAVAATGDFDAAGTAASAVAALSSVYQPLDSDLTAIAALTTTSFGRGLLALADAAALRTSTGLGGAAVLNVGTAAGTVAAGDDSRLTDSRTPTAHVTSHKSGGTDAIKLDDLSAPDDNTDLNVSTSAHGLTPKAPNDVTKFLNGLGAWSVAAPQLTAVKTAAYPAVSFEWVRFDLSAAGADVACTLPATPSVGDRVNVTLITAGSYSVQIGRNGSNVNGGTNLSRASLSQAGQTVSFLYVGGSTGWLGSYLG